MNPSASLVLIALAGPVFAQAVPQSYYISPPGTESLEGNSSSSIMFGYASSQVMQVDNTLTGIKNPLIRGLAYRRNANLTATAAHTIEIEIQAGHSVFSTVSSTYSTNYTSAPTVVFKKQKVKIDWSQKAALTPAEFDAVFPFAAPFLYNRKDAFVWESNTTTGTANSTYSQDWYSGSSPATIYGPRPSVLGTGCKTANGTMTLASSFRSTSATGFDYGFGVTDGPSSTGVLLYVGASDPNFPLFCGTLHVSPVFGAFIGATDAGGDRALAYASTTWNSTLVDTGAYTQAFALDSSQASGVAMSNGLLSRTARVPGGSASYAIKRLYTLNATNATSGSTPSLSSVATKYLQ